ncbi:hypothetical protein BC628DRAFT_891281 [Trametes gibbosa]|nr:hypothetical protein BC628DRAFT_891281 [Trametes gibbosa]
MFSQWRHAVESLAQPVKPAGSPESASGEEAARSSVDGIRTSLSSSTFLAESALNNLRKTLVAQRPGSPANANAQASTSPPEPAATPAPKPRPTARTTLEDRLRAKFAIGDASNSSTPASSSRASPAPVAVADHPLADAPSRSSTPDIPAVKGPPNPLSPRSTPLPDSPLMSPVPQPFRSFASHAANTSVTSLPLEPPSEPGTAASDPPAEQAVENEAPKAPEYTVVATQSDGSIQHGESTDEGPQLEESSDTLAPAFRTESPVPAAQPADVFETPDAESAAAASEEESAKVPATQASPDSSQITLAPPSDSQVAPADMPAPTSDIPSPLPDAPNPPPDAPEPLSNTPIPPSDAPEEIVASPKAAPEKQEHLEVVVEISPTPTPTAGLDEPIVSGEPATTNGDAVPTDTLTHQALADVETPLPGRSLEVPSRAGTPGLKDSDKTDVEALQKRLKLVEQRFTDVSTSFKRLQAEKLAADRVLREVTSVESVTEVDALRDFLQNMTLKNEMAQDEIRRLNGKLTRAFTSVDFV